MKKSFIIHLDMLCVLDELTDEQAGRLFKAIRNYHCDNEQNEHLLANDAFAKIAFVPFKNQFIRDDEKSKTGKHHWNWKGGISSENNVIRNSSKMREWRIAVFERDKYTCLHCGQKGGALNAHHIKPFSTHKKLRFNIDNGLTLCKKCHIELHKTDRQWLKK